jgi:hypothetical protein
MYTVRRFLSKYRKGSDRPEGEIDIADVPLRVLQRIFEEPETEPMYVVYVLEPRHVRALQRYIPEPLDIHRYDYFLEAEKIK